MIVKLNNRDVKLITGLNMDLKTGTLDEAYYLDTNEELTKDELLQCFELYHQEIHAEAVSHINDLMGRN